MTSGDAVFSNADIGKILCVSNATSAGPLVGYIGQVEDTRNVRLFTTLSFTTPANAGGNTSGQEAIWGTDCTAGMQAAFDAAEPIGPYGIGAVVVIGGIALVTRLLFGSISVVGLADTGCGFAALPLAGAQTAFFCDKAGGAYPGYATLRADAYTIKNITLYCQRFTSYYSSFRNGFEVRGGGFNSFRRGAPYARIENLDVYEAQWNGIVTNGAFAGQFNSVAPFQMPRSACEWAFGI